jgi:phosphohistidine swiveling domain-containing protein
MLAKTLGIPCIRACIGATGQLPSGQVIIVDAGSGKICCGKVALSFPDVGGMIEKVGG